MNNNIKAFMVMSLYMASIYNQIPNVKIQDGSKGLGNNWDGARASKDYVSTKRGNIRKEPKQNRNSICKCGSGKKYKHCCGKGQ